MAVACGSGFTATVTEQGDVWAFENGRSGVLLGLGTNACQVLPGCVGGANVFDGKAVVMVAAGRKHTACVVSDGTLWSWGKGDYGRLGNGDSKPRQRPERVPKEMFGGSPAVMVTCGNTHSLVLTIEGRVWSCGWGHLGRLGHGDNADKLVLTLVTAEGFRGAPDDELIIMVAAGGDHSVALGAQGRVWTWGWGGRGQLGHNDYECRRVPTPLDEVDFLGTAVLISAGAFHTVAVTSTGALWAWGHGGYGQLGLGDIANRLVPVWVGAEEAFEGSVVITAACGEYHTLSVTKGGALYSCGQGSHGALGHSDQNNRLVPTRVKAQHFGNTNIVSIAAGQSHSAAVTEDGGLYTWGDDRMVPTPIATHLLQGARVGCCNRLSPHHALAFAMGTHSRLGSAAPTAAAAGGQRSLQRHAGKAPAAAGEGKDCGYVTMPGDLVQRVVEACMSWGRAGELDGVVRLLNGGMMKERRST